MEKCFVLTPIWEAFKFMLINDNGKCDDGRQTTEVVALQCSSYFILFFYDSSACKGKVHGAAEFSSELFSR